MREPIVKRLVRLSGSLFALGILTASYYAMRELIVALVMFSLGFAALFLITLVLFLLFHCITDWVPGQLQSRTPRWNRASRDWMPALFGSALFRNEQTPAFVTINVRLPPVTRLHCRTALAENQDRALLLPAN